MTMHHTATTISAAESVPRFHTRHDEGRVSIQLADSHGADVLATFYVSGTPAQIAEWARKVEDVARVALWEANTASLARDLPDQIEDAAQAIAAEHA